jgi:hypothetical protein
MRITEVQLPMSEVSGQMMLQVCLTGERAFALRFWLGLPLMRLGAWIAGLGGIELVPPEGGYPPIPRPIPPPPERRTR